MKPIYGPAVCISNSEVIPSHSVQSLHTYAMEHASTGGRRLDLMIFLLMVPVRDVTPPIRKRSTPAALAEREVWHLALMTSGRLLYKFIFKTNATYPPSQLFYDYCQVSVLVLTDALPVLRGGQDRHGRQETLALVAPT